MPAMLREEESYFFSTLQLAVYEGTKLPVGLLHIADRHNKISARLPVRAPWRFSRPCNQVSDRLQRPHIFGLRCCQATPLKALRVTGVKAANNVPHVRAPARPTLREAL